MAEVIKITYSELESAANTFKTNADAIDTIITELSQKLGEVDSTWTGASKNAFYEQFETCKQNLMQFPDLLVGFAERLENAANTMRDADTQVGSQISGNA